MERSDVIFKPDKWQSQVLAHPGNVHLRTGRQVGKSTIVSRKTHQFAKDFDGVTILVISASIRQASYLYDKIIALFERDNEVLITKAMDEFKKKRHRFPSRQELRELQMKASLYAELPTKTKIILKNRTRIYCLPAGKTGVFIMGLTIDLLIADEAAFIPEPVWNAVLPMVAISRKIHKMGFIWLLSRPFGKGGYFYEAEHDIDFRSWHISSEQCNRIDKKFLIKERERMSKQEYAQEYLGEYVDEFNQFFATALIKKCMTFINWSYEKDYDRSKAYYLGVDIARYGADENAFVISEMGRDKKVIVVKVLTTRNIALTDTVGRVKLLDDRFHFRKIFIDDNSIGSGPTDMLIEKYGDRKVIGLNNSIKSVTGVTKRVLKEDMYSGALMLMETGKLEIVSDLALLRSLKSITYEYTADKRVRLHGNYSHLCEAFVRACWCIKERGLRVYIA